DQGYHAQGLDCVENKACFGDDPLVCPENSFCFTTENGYGECRCDDQFHKNETGDCIANLTCAELNCPQFEECSDVSGYNECVCAAGYYRNISGECVEDPCSGVVCGDNETCSSSDGECKCIQGYHSDGSQCVINETCEFINCGENKKCVIVEGLAVCVDRNASTGGSVTFPECTQKTVDYSGREYCICPPGQHVEGMRCVNDAIIHVEKAQTNNSAVNDSGEDCMIPTPQHCSDEHYLNSVCGRQHKETTCKDIATTCPITENGTINDTETAAKCEIVNGVYVEESYVDSVYTRIQNNDFYGCVINGSVCELNNKNRLDSSLSMETYCKVIDISEAGDGSVMSCIPAYLAENYEFIVDDDEENTTAGASEEGEMVKTKVLLSKAISVRDFRGTSYLGNLKRRQAIWHNTIRGINTAKYINDPSRSYAHMQEYLRNQETDNISSRDKAYFDFFGEKAVQGERNAAPYIIDDLSVPVLPDNFNVLSPLLVPSDFRLDIYNTVVPSGFFKIDTAGPVTDCDNFVLSKYRDYSLFNDLAAKYENDPLKLLWMIMSDDGQAYCADEDNEVGIDCPSSFIGFADGHNPDDDYNNLGYIADYLGSGNPNNPDLFENPLFKSVARKPNIFFDIIEKIGLSDSVGDPEGDLSSDAYYRMKNGLFAAGGTFNENTSMPDAGLIIPTLYGNTIDNFETYRNLVENYQTVEDLEEARLKHKYSKVVLNRIVKLLLNRANIEFLWNEKRTEIKSMFPGDLQHYGVSEIKESATGILRSLDLYNNTSRITTIDDIDNGAILTAYENGLYGEVDSLTAKQTALNKAGEDEKRKLRQKLEFEIRTEKFDETDNAKRLWGDYHYGKIRYALEEHPADPRKRADLYPKGDTEKLIEDVLWEIDSRIQETILIATGIKPLVVYEN
ncbi:MAG TPA: hypothetical protein PLD55_13855, partial [bacterium]|nr:hypothetical protein [bacterium]